MEAQQQSCGANTVQFHCYYPENPQADPLSGELTKGKVASKKVDECKSSQNLQRTLYMSRYCMYKRFFLSSESDPAHWTSGVSNLGFR